MKMVNNILSRAKATFSTKAHNSTGLSSEDESRISNSLYEVKSILSAVYGMSADDFRVADYKYGKMLSAANPEFKFLLAVFLKSNGQQNLPDNVFLIIHCSHQDDAEWLTTDFVSLLQKFGKACYHNRIKHLAVGFLPPMPDEDISFGTADCFCMRLYEG